MSPQCPHYVRTTSHEGYMSAQYRHNVRTMSAQYRHNVRTKSAQCPHYILIRFSAQPTCLFHKFRTISKKGHILEKMMRVPSSNGLELNPLKQ